MYDMIIIGAGIAGLTSALYSARAGKKTLVLGNSIGGQIIPSLHVENYPGYKDISGFELMNNIADQVRSLNVEIKNEDVIRINKNKEVFTNNNTYTCKALIIATGLENRKLNLENESKYLGNGISICATCDGAFFRDKEVAIVGGGNTAVEDALYLANLCSKVHLIHRGSSFKADKVSIDRVYSNDKIEVCLNEEVASIDGDYMLKNITLKSGRKLDIDGLFIAIGRVPNSKLYEELVNTENGYIITDDDCKTNCPFIFAAGDCRKKSVRQLVTAASDGAIAATSAAKYIEKEC